MFVCLHLSSGEAAVNAITQVNAITPLARILFMSVSRKFGGDIEKQKSTLVTLATGSQAMDCKCRSNNTVPHGTGFSARPLSG